MNNTLKKESFRKWLASNPGKTERDWLIDERCSTEEQRMALTKLLNHCNDFELPYHICYVVDLKKELSKFWEENDYNIVTLNGIQNIANEDIVFDLYFPHKGWFINIGSEIKDVKKLLQHVPSPWDKELEFLKGPVLFEKFGSDIAWEHRFLQIYFSDYLMSKYTFPQYNSGKNSKKDQGILHQKKLLILPWNYDVMRDEENSDLPNYIKVGDISMFYKYLKE